MDSNEFSKLELTCIVYGFSLFSLWIIVTTEPISVCLDRFLSVSLLYLVQPSPVMVQILKLLNLSKNLSLLDQHRNVLLLLRGRLSNCSMM